MSSESLTIRSADGLEFDAYVSRPKTEHRPVVVVIQEIFGVNKVMRDIADWVAEQGFIAIVPDLFHRQEKGIQLTDQTEAEWARAFELYKGFNEDLGVDDLKATVATTRKLDGSNGKTGTKHLITSALAARLRGGMSPKSFNNDIGVPVSIFAADPNQDFLVLELGTNHPGEIRNLTEIARPDVAVITNCSAEHLEYLGDLMGVRQENASIIQGLSPKGLLVVNGDDPQLLEAVAGYRGKIVTFGFGPTNDLFATDIVVEETHTSFSLNGRTTRVRIPMLGRHAACNALAAIAVARRLGVAEDMFIAALAESSAPEWRMQRIEVGGVTVLNDAYNANPASMRAAIETFVMLDPARRKIAVLGDMRELGTNSERYHREIGSLVASIRDDVDQLLTVGPNARWFAQSAIEAGFDAKRIKSFDDTDAAYAAIPKSLQPGDMVLLKGSRAIGLEQIATRLVETPRRLFGASRRRAT